MPLGAFKAGIFGAAGGGSEDKVAIEAIADSGSSWDGNSVVSFTSIPQTYDDLLVTFGSMEIYTSPNQTSFYVTEIQPYLNEDYSNSWTYDFSVAMGDPNPAGTIFRTVGSSTGDLDNFGYASDKGNGNEHTAFKMELQITNYTKTDVYKNLYWRSANMTAPSSWIGGKKGFGCSGNTGDISRAITKVSFRTGGNPNWFDGESRVTLWGISRGGV